MVPLLFPKKSPLTKEQLLKRKAFLETRVCKLTERLGSANRSIVRARITDHLAMLNSRLDRINEKLATMG